ncbi:MAG: DUF6745 domain-containing protein [Cyanobacteria bacterium J06643_5]
MIINLTLEQQSSISYYKEKWKRITLSTQPINREKVLTLVETTYNIFPCSITPPEVIFFDSPFAAFSHELNNAVSNSLILSGEGLVRTDLWFEIDLDLHLNLQIDGGIWQNLTDELEDEIGSRMYKKIWHFLERWFFEHLKIQLKDNKELFRYVSDNFIDDDWEWALYAGLFDFCFNKLNYQYEYEEDWKHYLAMVRECGWWFLPTTHYYIFCDRPIKILLDENELLHAEGETAIQYSDGFGLYANHGEITSAKYP